MRILFQGDSITDANRETTDGFDLYNNVNFLLRIDSCICFNAEKE